MKKILPFLLAISAFADSLILDNQSNYPKENSKIAVQWASSAREVDEGNALLYGSEINPKSLKTISQMGKVTLNIPKKAEYFRILLWLKGKGEIPDRLTNWVDVVPDKTYLLKGDHLTPTLLLQGTGC